MSYIVLRGRWCEIVVELVSDRVSYIVLRGRWCEIVVELVSDRVLYIVLRGRWCEVIVWSVHSSSKEKSDDSKDSFYEELEQLFFYHFPKYHTKIVLGDFNSKVERENIFKPTIVNENLHEDSNDNEVRIVNFATSKF